LHDLHTLCGPIDKNVHGEPTNSGFTLRFDDGIVGRAYYMPHARGIAYSVLVSFPFQAPDRDGDGPGEPHGVFSLGSRRADYPLRAGPRDPEREDLFRAFHAQMDSRLCDGFVAIFLDQSEEDPERAV
jgi:hypothetical protein